MAKDVWQGAAMKWLTSAIYSSVKTMGARQAKVMTRAMSLVFVRALAAESKAAGGPAMEPVADPAAALEQYRTMEGQQGLADPANVAFRPKEDGEIQIEFRSCPYGSLCNQALAELLSRGDFNKASVPCIRMDTYSAALALAANSKRPYRLIQFAPGARCQAGLMPARGGK